MAGVDFSGKWKEYKAENKEAVLKKMGVAEEKISQWVAFKPIMEMKHEGNKHILTLSGDDGKVFYNQTIEMDVPYTPAPIPGAPDLGEMVSTFEEGGIFRTKTTGKKEYIDDMTLENGELKVVQKCGGEECASYYKKV